MRKDYLADVRTGKMPVERLREFLRSSGSFSDAELTRASTKFALVNLAEAKSVDLEPLRTRERYEWSLSVGEVAGSEGRLGLKGGWV